MRSMDQIVAARDETLEVFRDEPQDARKAARDAAEFMLSTLQAGTPLPVLNEFVTGNLESLERAVDLFDRHGENSAAEGLRAMHHALTALAGNAKPEPVPASFAEWFARNYPRDSMIFDPDWHAPRIYRAALAHAQPAPPPGTFDGDSEDTRAAFREYDKREPVSNRTAWQVWRDALAWYAQQDSKPAALQRDIARVERDRALAIADELRKHLASIQAGINTIIAKG